MFRGGPILLKLKINFRDPGDILDKARFQSAGVSAAIYVRRGPIDRDLSVGQTLHLVYDTPDGRVMRSRFWLGELDPAPAKLSAEQMRALVPDERVAGLHQYACEEISILGSFSPRLYK